MDADDPFDTISGTLGLTGGVDTIALLKRHTRGVTLHIQGRDLVDVHRSKDERLVIETLRMRPALPGTSSICCSGEWSNPARSRNPSAASMRCRPSRQRKRRTSNDADDCVERGGRAMAAPRILLSWCANRP
jgi:hypothetical protein